MLLAHGHAVLNSLEKYTLSRSLRVFLTGMLLAHELFSPTTLVNCIPKPSVTCQPIGVAVDNAFLSLTVDFNNTRALRQ